MSNLGNDLYLMNTSMWYSFHKSTTFKRTSGASELGKAITKEELEDITASLKWRLAVPKELQI